MVAPPDHKARIAVPTRMFENQDGTGRILDTLPAGATVVVKSSDHSPWIYVCAMLGRHARCGYIHKSNTNHR